MKLSILTKRTTASLFAFSDLAQAMLRWRARQGYVILMYHRILQPDTVKLVQPGMYVDKETFEHHINLLKKHFEVIRLVDLFCLITGSWKSSFIKPLCALTFDDGWIDFYRNAYPVLLKHQVPATVFLPTNFVGTTKWFWTDQLTHLLEHGGSNRLKTSFLGQLDSDPIASAIVELQGSKEKRLEQAIGLLKNCAQGRIDDLLGDLASHWGLDLNPGQRAFFSWKETEEMYKSGFVAFGSHTVSHRILTLCSDEEAVYELTSSKNKLKSQGIVGDGFVPFCYPNGNYNTKIVKMVKEAGYQMAVTTETGWNKWNSPALSLRRIGIHQDMTSTDAMFSCRVAGIF